jgi:hypothetical protein
MGVAAVVPPAKSSHVDWLIVDKSHNVCPTGHLVLIAPIDATVCRACCFDFGEKRNDPHQAAIRIARIRQWPDSNRLNWRPAPGGDVTLTSADGDLSNTLSANHRGTDSQPCKAHTAQHRIFPLSTLAQLKGLAVSIDTHASSCGLMLKTRQHAVVGRGESGNNEYRQNLHEREKKRCPSPLVLETTMA